MSIQLTRAQWERWDSMLPNGEINPGGFLSLFGLTTGNMTSFNHYALGSVASFLHEAVGGLAPAESGWKKALIRPRPGGTVSSAVTSFSSPYGTYSVSWELKGEDLHVDVVVPPNGCAKVILPGLEVEIGSGNRAFASKWKAEPWPPKGIPGPQSFPMPDNYWA